ncbi:phosphoribosylanthranilate isomerase [Erythrobacter sp. Alg231-14]|uniref:phosphoribosylanthranilate isomerase n=1 Tax=Erythrobacter sp. Alg231-14 TaxID=1922225 RepID=UPI000D560475
MLIKICGLTSPDTIAAAADAGASHIGLMHFEKSVRHIGLETATELRASVPSGVKSVLLLVNAAPDAAERAIKAVQPDIVQFHGAETPEYTASIRAKFDIEVWRAMGVRSIETLNDAAQFKGKADRLLYDAPPLDARPDVPGGTGAKFDWSLLKGHEHRVPWGLAGGLNPDNVAGAIRATNAPLVDVSSGVESAPGVKDVDRIAAFCKAALNA